MKGSFVNKVLSELRSGNAQLLRLSFCMGEHKHRCSMIPCQVLWIVIVTIEVVWGFFKFLL